jgi:cell division protein FtsZ
MDEIKEKKISVMALGGAGCRILREIAKDPLAAPLNLIAVDTDRDSLAETGLPEEKQILAGVCWRDGAGCGGSPLDGQRAIAHERFELEKAIQDSSLLLVIGGLGGGTCSGGAQVAVSVAHKQNIPVMFLLTLPFSLEGHSRRKIAEDTVKKELTGLADAVICLPNDLLFSVLDPTTRLSDAFALADREVSRSVIALTVVLTQGNLLRTDLSSFLTILKRRKSYCSFGVSLVRGEPHSNQRVQDCMEQLLSSPLLGGAEKLRKADSVILSLIGPPDLALGETKALMELAGTYTGEDSQLVTGAATAECFSNELLLCALAVEFDRESELGVEKTPEESAPVRTRKSRKTSQNTAQDADDAVQQLLPMDVVTCGIMEKTAPVIWENENLDIPTFQRRGIVVDTGKDAPR